MRKPQHAANPFVMMTNPSAVLQALAHSERLGELRSRVFRPLDDLKGPPLSSEQAEFDRALDAGISTSNLARFGHCRRFMRNKRRAAPSVSHPLGGLSQSTQVKPEPA